MVCHRNDGYLYGQGEQLGLGGDRARSDVIPPVYGCFLGTPRGSYAQVGSCYCMGVQGGSVRGRFPAMEMSRRTKLGGRTILLKIARLLGGLVLW